MQTRRIARHCLIATLLLVILHPSAWGQVFFRWIDPQGQLHLSDQPPPPQVGPIERIETPTYQPPALSSDEDPYSILNQARRMAESREQLARERMEQQRRDREYELHKRALEAQQAPPPPPAVSAPVYAYPYPQRPRPPAHRPDWNPPNTRPWSLWKPDHPAFRPYSAPQHPGVRRPAARIEFE